MCQQSFTSNTNRPNNDKVTHCCMCFIKPQSLTSYWAACSYQAANNDWVTETSLIISGTLPDLLRKANTFFPGSQPICWRQEKKSKNKIHWIHLFNSKYTHCITVRIFIKMMLLSFSIYFFVIFKVCLTSSIFYIKHFWVHYPMWLQQWGIPLLYLAFWEKCFRFVFVVEHSEV